MKQYFIFLVLLIIGAKTLAQPVFLRGKVSNTNQEALSYVTIQIKELQIGTITNDKGEYEVKIPEGKYDIIFSLIGYITKKETVIVENENTTHNVILDIDYKTLAETKIIAVKTDNANDIVKQIISNKEKYQHDLENFSCQVYIKALQIDSSFSKKNIKQKQKSKPEDSTLSVFQKDSLAQKLRTKFISDSITGYYNKLAFAEIFLTLEKGENNNIKETREAVQYYGNTSSLFYLRTTEADFNLYKNQIAVPALSAIPFISPISFSGTLGYKYKTKKIFFIKNKKYYTISFTPIKIGNALIKGEFDVMDSIWAITRTSFELPSYHTPEYDYFSVTQNFKWLDTVLVLNNQNFKYFAKIKKGKVSGNSYVSYINYKTNLQFEKNHFKNELSRTLDSAYSKPTLYWQSARTEPLSPIEYNFIKYKDSLYQVTHTQHYLDSIDKETNRISFKRVMWDGLTFYKRAQERTIYIGPALTMYRPFYLGGTRLGNNCFVIKKFKSKKTVYLATDVTYGLRNKDLLGTFTFGRTYNPITQGRFTIEVSKNFELINYNDAWINILQRANYYLSNKIAIYHRVELFNGLMLTNWLEFAARSSVANYKINSQTDSLFKGILKNNTIVNFASYNAFYNNIKLEYTPFQKYIREPKEKIILGSKYPTFYITWRKGLPTILNSKIDFDFLELGFSQKKLIGVAGILQYKFSAGTFLSKKNVQLIDNKFIRRGDPIFFSNPTRNFQTLDSTFSVYNWFYEMHALHEFNGAVLNKIPYLKKLKLLEVAGASYLYVPERKLQYFEIFGGLEKTFRIARDKYKVGVYLVSAIANKFNNPIQIKIGIEQYNKTKNSW